MAYRIPTFNLRCNIWSGFPSPPYPPAGAPRVTGQMCQLAADHILPLGTALSIGMPMFIRMPALADVRSALSTTLQDVIECPAGSGNWFTVRAVFDVAKGFANEYRVAVVTQSQTNTPMA